MAAKTRKSAREGGKTPFLRLLPALIGVGVLMLSVRVTDIWKGIFDLGSLRVASELQAQQGPRGGAPEEQPQQVAQAQPATQPGPSAAAQSAPKPPPPVPAASTQSAAAPSGADTGSLSQTEMDVLQKLSERRGAIELRERDLERREAMLKAAEDQIERKIAEMRTLQNTIEGLLRQYNDQEDNKMRSLVKIYENMKPKEAAKIFEQLDMNILLEVVERMKEQRVAPIMAEMDPSKAKAVTAELAQRRQIPVPKPASGG